MTTATTSSRAARVPAAPAPAGWRGRSAPGRSTADRRARPRRRPGAAHPLLEQLVQPAVGQLPLPARRARGAGIGARRRRAGSAAVLRVGLGGDQRQRGEVVPGDPGGAVGVDRLRPVAQPQAGGPTVVFEGPHPQHACLRERLLSPCRSRSLEAGARCGRAAWRRRRQEVRRAPVAPTLLGAGRDHELRHDAGAVVAGRAAGGAGLGDVTGGHLVLAGQRSRTVACAASASASGPQRRRSAPGERPGATGTARRGSAPGPGARGRGAVVRPPGGQHVVPVLRPCRCRSSLVLHVRTSVGLPHRPGPVRRAPRARRRFAEPPPPPPRPAPVRRPGCPPQPFFGGDLLALHQEGLGGRAPDPSPSACRSGSTRRSRWCAPEPMTVAVGLESVVLLGVALDERGPAFRTPSSPMVTEVPLGEHRSRRRRAAGPAVRPAPARTRP